MTSSLIIRTFLKLHQWPLHITKCSSSIVCPPIVSTKTQKRSYSSLKASKEKECRRSQFLLVPNSTTRISQSQSIAKRNYGSIHEPEYLDTTGPEIPLYDLLNLQIKGYDFPVLEKFSKYVHHTAERIGLSVEEAWATPGKNLKVTKLKPESTVVETEYALTLYERNVQIADVPATLLPVFVNVIEACIPAGVSVRIHPHLPEHTELRYVPDMQLKELRTQLDTMRGEKK